MITKVTREQIEREFGARVARLVWAVTGIGRNRQERNADQYAKIRDYPDAAIVKAADRIANIEACRRNGGWRRRIQSQKIDVTAHVSIEGELAVVVAVQAKDYLGGAQQRRARTDVTYPMREEDITLHALPPREPTDEVIALRARVAELEAQLHNAKK